MGSGASKKAPTEQEVKKEEDEAKAAAAKAEKEAAEAADAAKKAEKEASKTASLTKEDKFDAFGNKIEDKGAKKKLPKSELKKIKKRVADLRKKGQEIWTDEEIEKEGYELPE